MLLEFVNREKELEFLETRYESNKPEFIPVYGRRRVGKTELLKHFIKDKPHCYFLAKKKDLKSEMDRFRLKFSQESGEFIPDSNGWDELFEYILKNKKEKLVIIIDEFPLWIEKDKSILSDFQHLWDETLKDKNIFLILCGSYVSVMETDVLGYKSPLYGRRTGQLEINKLNFKEFTKFFPRWSKENQIRAYGALDGIPFYIKEFELNKNFLENIENTFWKSGSILSKEVEFLLSQELREVEVYLSILMSIFEGARKLNEIALKSKVDITNINKYLNVLINLKFISKEYPVVVNLPKRKNFLYRINDNFFNFWLRYVYNFRDDIEIGELEHLKNFFKKDHDSYLGFAFENICRQIIPNLKLPFRPTKTGRWWYKETEIDLVCLDEENKEVLFLECKWSELNENEALNVLEKLKEKTAQFRWSSEKQFLGIIAKKVKEKEKLRKKGFTVFDLDDF